MAKDGIAYHEISETKNSKQGKMGGSLCPMRSRESKGTMWWSDAYISYVMIKSG